MSRVWIIVYLHACILACVHPLSGPCHIAFVRIQFPHYTLAGNQMELRNTNAFLCLFSALTPTDINKDTATLKPH